MQCNEIREEVLVSFKVMYVSCLRNQAWQHNLDKGQTSITMKISCQKIN